MSVRFRVAVRSVAAALLLGGAAVVPSAPAQAHDALVSSNPEDGATLKKEPTQVSLTFNEDVGRPAFVVVRAPDGSRLDAGDPQVVDATVTQQVDHFGSAGGYTVSYRVVSADGHPVEATFRYAVSGGRNPEIPRPIAHPVADTPDPSFMSQHRGLLLLGGLVVVAVAALLLWPRTRNHG